MAESFLTLNQEILERWYASATAAGIGPERYHFQAKRVSNPQGTFSFGVIWNSEREQRPRPAASKTPTEPAEKPSCPLCITLDRIVGDTTRNIVPLGELPSRVVIPNLFPATPGHTLAITAGTGDGHISMYDTLTLPEPEQIAQVLDFADKTGFRIYHNGKDSGASIVEHEHDHLTNFAIVYETLGVRYGFDDAELEDTRTRGVRHMPAFPFAHLVFQQDQPDRIIAFLRSMQSKMGHKYDDGTIPHGTAQGENKRGILVVPTKNCMADGLPGIGSGDMAGHIPVGSEEEFKATTYDSCVQRLAQRLYTTDEMNLAQFL
jgi:hypothetical protein